MKAFRFQLHAVLTLRQRKEQTTLENYAAAMQHEQQRRQQFDQAVQALQAGWLLWQNQLTQGVDAQDVNQTREHCELLEKRQRERFTAWQSSQDALQKRWQELMAARQDRKVVERYCEKKKEQHLRACMREEQKMLDELAIGRASQASQTNHAGILLN